MEEYLNSEDFFDLCQHYRNANQFNQDEVVKRFNNLKKAILDNSNKV